MSNALTIQEPQNESIALIREALSTGADPATLRELLAVRREWEADEGRKAYFRSISAFQQRAPIIEKSDKAYDKMYARMDRIWRTVRPLMTELGLSCTWQSCEIGNDGKLCHVTGQLGHILGHSVPLVMDVAIPELLKGQNAAQQIGSARTYAQRYAFCAALGIQTGEDDDAAALSQKITPAMVADLTSLLQGFGKSWEAERDAVLGWREVNPLKLENLLLSDYELVKATITRKLAKANAAP